MILLFSLVLCRRRRRRCYRLHRHCFATMNHSQYHRSTGQLVLTSVIILMIIIFFDGWEIA